MVALAAAVDVAHELGLEDDDALSSTQTARIPGLLIKASSTFRRLAGRQFTPDIYTHRCQVIGGRFRPLETPVVSVESVVDDSGNVVAYTRSGDWFIVSGHHDTDASFACYRPEGLSSGWFVTINYTGGGIPEDVRVTVAQIVARALNIDPDAATGLKAHDQTLGPISERKQFFDWAAESVPLTEEETAFAESFRDPRGARIVSNGGHSHHHRHFNR